MQRPSPSQWDLLALTRFILAIVVLVGHLDAEPSLSRFWTGAGTYLNQGSAVYGFLLISGYSIAASLDRSEPGFLWRRVRRIYPTYLASLALTALAMVTGVVAPEPASRFVLMLLMLQTFAGPTLEADGQLWTLAVEWWNYLAAPVLRRLPDLAALALAALSLALYLLLKLPVYPAPTTGGLMFAMISWFWLVGFLYYRRRGTLYGYAILFLPLALAANFGWIGRAVWIGAIALAICEALAVPDRLKAFFRWLGDLSYPIYAMQIPTLAFCLHWGFKSPALTALVVLAVSVVVLHAVDLPARAVGRGKARSAPLRADDQVVTDGAVILGGDSVP